MGDARVLVVAGSPGPCQDLILACGRKSSARVLGPVPDAAAALAAAKTTRVDLALVDLDRADGAGLDTIARIRDAGIRVLVCTTDTRVAVATAALAAGACGVIPRSADSHTYVDALRRITSGEIVLVDRHLSSVAREVRAAALTVRELEVLRLLAQGRGTMEIADAMGISPTTVRVHVKNLLAKMQAHSKVEAVRTGWRHHLVAVPVPA